MSNLLLFYDFDTTIQENLEENVGNNVRIRIGSHMWYSIEVIAVDKETDYLTYRSDEYPAECRMEMKYIDEFAADVVAA